MQQTTFESIVAEGEIDLSPKCFQLLYGDVFVFANMFSKTSAAVLFDAYVHEMNCSCLNTRTYLNESIACVCIKMTSTTRLVTNTEDKLECLIQSNSSDRLYLSCDRRM